MRSRLLALWLFLGTVLIGVIALPMLVLGPDLLRRAFPRSVRHTVSSLIDAGFYPVLIVVLLLGLATFYKLAPPRRLPWHRGLPGAVVAGLIFLAGSAGLRAYIRFILDRNHAYGALAAPIAALLFFFVLALGVLFGAEFNAAIEQMKPAKTRPPRVLDPRNWQVFGTERPAVNGTPAGSAVAHEVPDGAAGPTLRRVRLARRTRRAASGQSDSTFS